MKLFKNCNVLYFKKNEEFNEFLNSNPGIFKGKIIISDSPELNRVCSINGIIHVLNLNSQYIPNEKIDCIIDSHRNTELEAKIIRSGLGIQILYITENSRKHIPRWCGVCNTMSTVDSNLPISRYCSEKCMKKESGFTMDSKPEVVRDLGLNNIVSRIVQAEADKDVVIEFDKSLSDKRTTSNLKKSADKFQTSMVKDAIRLEYAFKRETYKKEMRQPSLRKASISDKKAPVSAKVGEIARIKNEEPVTTRLCKSVTKKGKKCTNKALGSSDFCGILSHSIQSKSIE